MNVTIKLFSLAKDLAGFEERRIQLAAEATAAEILHYLSELNPTFDAWKGSVRLAVNQEYVPNSHPLREGDEVAVIPPVSGG
jgi:molybdopterin converting factor subunit 1